MSVSTDNITGGTSTTVGTGPLVISSTLAGHRDIRTVLSNGAQRRFYAKSATQWMLFVGTYNTSGTSITVNSVVNSSNSDAAVNWTGSAIKIIISLAKEDQVLSVNDLTGNAVLTSKHVGATPSGLSYKADGEPIFMIAFGDSNIVGGGGTDSTIAAAANNSRVFCYALATAAEAYNIANLDWVQLNPSAAARSTQQSSAYAALKAMTGQLLGSYCSPALLAADKLQRETGRDVYLYQNAMGGLETNEWMSSAPVGFGYDTMFSANNDGCDAAIAAMNAITGLSQTFADVIICSLGANDINTSSVTGANWYTRWSSIYADLIAQGWLDIDRTQYFHIENVNNSQANIVARYKIGWSGYSLMTANSNERVKLISSMGAATVNSTDLHYIPAQYDSFADTITRMALQGATPTPAWRQNTYIEKLAPVLGANLNVGSYGLYSPVANAANAVAHYSDTVSLTTTSTKLWSFRNNGTEKVSIDYAGSLTGLNTAGLFGSVALRPDPLLTDKWSLNSFGGGVSMDWTGTATGAAQASYSFKTNKVNSALSCFAFIATVAQSTAGCNLLECHNVVGTPEFSISYTGLPGFFSKTAPVAQTTAGGRVAIGSAGGTDVAYRNTTYTGDTGSSAFTTGDIVRALKDYGLLPT